MGQILCCFHEPEENYRSIPESPPNLGINSSSDFRTISDHLPESGPYQSVFPPYLGYDSEQLETQLKEISRLDLSKNEITMTYSIKVNASLQSIVSRVSNRINQWAEQIFEKGWNIHILKVVNSAPQLVYHVTLSNRYLDPISPSVTLIYRGRPYLEKWCVVCEDEYSSHIFIPCGHLCICTNCIHLYDQVKYLSCPICRNSAHQLTDAKTLGFRWTDSGSESED